MLAFESVLCLWFLLASAGTADLGNLGKAYLYYSLKSSL